MKRCRICKEEKPLTDYHPNKECKGGVVATCRSCTGVRIRQWYADNRDRRQVAANQRNQEVKRAMIEQFGDKCHDCGQSFPACVYDFHHTDPTQKDVNPSRAMTMAEERRNRELSKCVMLCANCHRVRHFGKSDLTDRLEDRDESAN